MTTNKEFKNILEICKKENQYVGLGEPNSNILFIGKEAGDKIENEINHGNAESWLEEKNDYSKRFIPQDKRLRNGNHTWQKYQKLYELILCNLNIEFEKKEKEITFVEKVFTTELNNLHAPSSIEAKKRKGFKENLNKRKDIFINSDFIQKFPIVLICASDNKYIETYRGEVCERFNVEFDREITFNNGKIWLHYNKEGNPPKILIHTRQLTNGASNELIEKIGVLISEFITENNIEIK